jgi:hypothetical protein
MEMWYFFGGIIVLVLIGFAIQKLNEFKSPYYKISKKLKEDLLQANFTSDWRNRQEINLRLLWLDTIKEMESKDFLGKKKEEDISSLTAKLSETDLTFPIKWKLSDDRIPKFAERIIQDFGRVIADSKYKGMYKPDNILPYPKTFIKKSIMYTLDYSEYDKAVYKAENKDSMTENLKALYSALNRFFVDTGNEDLPIETIDNMDKGKLFYERQEPTKDEDRLFDWRD